MAAADPALLQLCLISHTNAGKTTLARTLIGADIGVVRDAAHVTETSDSHMLLRTQAGDELLLWDTPGFGDSARLGKRLAMSGNPMGWFLSEVWDRLRDRPFWLSQRALLTARDNADVILYLVNAAESPEDAGYLEPEMQILQWLGKPVIVLLNQMGPPAAPQQEHQEQTRWHGFFAGAGFTCTVIPLDAFARCWVHEQVLFDAVGKVIAPPKRAGYQRLMAAWDARNQDRYRRSMAALALELSADARDAEPLAGAGGTVTGRLRTLAGSKRQAEEQASSAIELRAAVRAQQSTETLLELHGLSGKVAAALHERLATRYTIKSPLGVRQAGVVGALLSGAATGAYADALTGGLTLGAGAVLGALAGAAGFAGAAWSVNKVKGAETSTVYLSDAALFDATTTALLRYLAVAHFGRGRGLYQDSEAPMFWQDQVRQTLQLHQQELALTWTRLRRRVEPPASAEHALAGLLARATRDILAVLYPQTPSTLAPRPDAAASAIMPASSNTAPPPAAP